MRTAPEVVAELAKAHEEDEPQSMVVNFEPGIRLLARADGRHRR